MSAPRETMGTMEACAEHPQVTRASDRYEIRLQPDGEPVGFAQYRDQEGADGVPERVFPHTVVDPEHTGQGLAGQLVRHALEDTAAQGLRIVPACSYVRHWIRTHPDVVGRTA